jgi:hypothetical protein
MSHHVRGKFEVRLTPQSMAEPGGAEPGGAEPGGAEPGVANLGRLSIAKRYFGDLDGTGTGEMLTASGTVAGSAVYVAVERVTGTLSGRRGSFALHHTGIMDRGAAQLTITVVPDSGSGDLAGLTGSMSITIAEKEHFYDFEYALPASE